MSFKSDLLALIFGGSMILLIFGDQNLAHDSSVIVGNLDAVFGLRLWPIMDIIYPLVTVLVFLLYGYVKSGGFRFRLPTFLLFVSFLAVLFLVIADDVTQVLYLDIHFSRSYWIATSAIYEIYGSFAFFLYGKLHERKPVNP
jgi:hypothetical protein